MHGLLSLSFEVSDNNIVRDIDRNKLISHLKKIHENNFCFDCGTKNTGWISTNNGIFLCLNCSGKHRNYGVKTSFIRSLEFDSLTKEECLYMEIGGNLAAAQYFKTKSNITFNSINAENYRNELKNAVQAALNGTYDPKSDETFKEEQISVGTVINEPVVNEKRNNNYIKESDDFSFDFDKAFEMATVSKNDNIYNCNNEYNAIVKGCSHKNSSYNNDEGNRNEYSNSDNEKYKGFGNTIVNDCNNRIVHDDKSENLKSLCKNAVSSVSDFANSASAAIQEAVHWLNNF